MSKITDPPPDTPANREFIQAVLHGVPTQAEMEAILKEQENDSERT